MGFFDFGNLQKNNFLSISQIADSNGGNIVQGLNYRDQILVCRSTKIAFVNELLQSLNSVGSIVSGTCIAWNKFSRILVGQNSGGVVYTDNDGAGFVSSAGTGTRIDAIAANGDICVVKSNAGWFTSVNNGNTGTWNAVFGMPLNGVTSIECCKFHPELNKFAASGSTAVTTTGQISLSEDGINWQHLTIVGFGSIFTTCVFNGKLFLFSNTGKIGAVNFDLGAGSFALIDSASTPQDPSVVGFVIASSGVVDGTIYATGLSQAYLLKYNANVFKQIPLGGGSSATVKSILEFNRKIYITSAGGFFTNLSDSTN